MGDSTKIVLGSGELFIDEYDGETIPPNEEIEKEEKRLGFIQGGASIEYKPTYYTAKDDLGIKQKTIITEEEATLKSGIITFNGTTLKKLCETARIEEDAEKQRRIVKIGGSKNANGKKYVLHFVHRDKEYGDIKITIIGKNMNGFSLAFSKDKETVIDAEFKCQSMDKDGTLIIYEEQLLSSSKNTVNI